MDKELTINLSILRKIPAGHIIDIKTVKDMDDIDVECVVLKWSDDLLEDVRTSFFSIKNGVYCGECIYP